MTRTLIVPCAVLAILVLAAASYPALRPSNTAAARASVPTAAGTAQLAALQMPRTGVTTHFSQGWPARLMDDAKALGTATLRDSIHWPQVERTPGRFDFTESNSGHVSRACLRGMTVLLGLEPRNPLYDEGKTAWSATAQAAFARYVAAIADRWPRCVIAVEIGNEINGRDGMTGPAASDRPRFHVALLKAVHQAVKPRQPDLALLGGSTNMIATGFLERLFRAGALDWVDGIAVHPYRPDPEGVDEEIASLRAAMARVGATRPVWITEFSRDFTDPADAAPYYLKSIALMESAGVSNHFWYALADQSHFPTMGLARLDGTRKPAGHAYAFAARELAPLGPARRVEHGDRGLFHFRFGADTHVVWGARRPLHAPARARAFAADGTPQLLPTTVSDTPVVIRGAGNVTFGAPEVLADSLYGFGAAPLAWSVRRVDGGSVPLVRLDGQWSSYLGAPAIATAAAYPAGIGTGPRFGTRVRFTAPNSRPVVVTACLWPARAGMTAVATFEHRGAVLWRARVGPAPTRGAAAITVRAGETIDLVVMPAPGSAPARLRYRFRAGTPGSEPAPCPQPTGTFAMALREEVAP